MKVRTNQNVVAASPGSRELSELIRRLVAAYDPERVYLFGSMARGDAGPDSDYDLMIIVPDDAAPERRRSRLAYRAMRGTGTAADVLVWLKSNFERRAHVVASLPPTLPASDAILGGCRPTYARERMQVEQGLSRLKGGCGQDWPPHYAK